MRPACVLFVRGKQGKVEVRLFTPWKIPRFEFFLCKPQQHSEPPAMLSAFSKHDEEEANLDRYQIPVLRTCPKMALIKIVIFDRNYTGRGISPGLLKFFS